MIKPKSGHIVVQTHVEESNTIFVGVKSKDTATYDVVIVAKDVTWPKVNDRIIGRVGTAVPFSEGGETFYILDHNDVMGTIE